ncbi:MULTISPECIES: Tim44/TimA family putative adaptor protein [Sphingomonas]|uniref:Tim44/TimA family putative adaptor protein n=1 Tax=Sphingomonas TaxID=13687 RepID=UPI000A7CF8CA|nr:MULTISPECIES: Tim44/TimA family putative adaptor protein [Sphingomonas]MBY0302384.1 Tim44/TimA family putative adaptor protein [Sphingomonas ginsenosidimutans]
MFYVVVLAMVAAFLALRLYSVLGKRGGHEQPLPRAAEERVAAPVMPRPVDAAPDVREPAARPFEGAAEAGLRAIVQAEPGFDVARFVEGAKGAYRMVLEAFWRGDEQALRALVTDDVFASFSQAIAERREAGHVLDNRLVTIERAVISAASVQNGEARITVRFDADIAAVTRDGEGQVIAGSTSDAIETHDEWTFVRTMRSTDPNWLLADTDEA